MANPIVGKHPHACLNHRVEIDQLASLQTLGYGRNGNQARAADLACPLQHVMRYLHTIVDRQGIRHRRNGSKTARRRRA
jgi:hypothetical protein